MTWSTDEILEVNPAQPGQLRSKLERILPWAQANLEILAEIADEIEARPSNHVAAFFQLPYAIIAPGSGIVFRRWSRDYTQNLYASHAA